jgi:hypothetical protein
VPGIWTTFKGNTLGWDIKTRGPSCANEGRRRIADTILHRVLTSSPLSPSAIAIFQISRRKPYLLRILTLATTCRMQRNVHVSHQPGASASAKLAIEFEPLARWPCPERRLRNVQYSRLRNRARVSSISFQPQRATLGCGEVAVRKLGTAGLAGAERGTRGVTPEACALAHR